MGRAPSNDSVWVRWAGHADFAAGAAVAMGTAGEREPLPKLAVVVKAAGGDMAGMGEGAWGAAGRDASRVATAFLTLSMSI